MNRQLNRSLMAVAIAVLAPALARADGTDCADGSCHSSPLIDRIPYIQYLRMHWGHQRAPEEYASACYGITPSYRFFKPDCWYVQPAALYPTSAPSKELSGTQATSASMAAPPQPMLLPAPRPLPQGPESK